MDLERLERIYLTKKIKKLIRLIEENKLLLRDYQIEKEEDDRRNSQGFIILIGFVIIIWIITQIGKCVFDL